MTKAEFDTIVAPATPLGRSALAIVRLDGRDALAIARQVSENKELKPRSATFAVLRNEDGEPIDEAVVTYFAAAASYTGNDLVEFTSHGSPAIVQQLIETLMQLGARMAEPGEFTERAVLNGRIDLLQAEAVGDLIASRTPLQARLALRNLDGELTATADRIRTSILAVISRLEGSLDFVDEGYEFISSDEAAEKLIAAVDELRALAMTFVRGRASISGLEAVILGRPNAGKSSLMNFLCGSERAIVTPIAGTTRDLLRETIELGGLPVTLIDTAGLRAAGDEIETIGIERARQAALGADLILYLVDSSVGLSSYDLAELETYSNPFIIFTKVDLAPAPPGELGVSVETREGVGSFLETLDALVRQRYAVPESSAVVVNARQFRAVMSALESLDASISAVRQKQHAELILVDLYASATALAGLVGAISGDDVVHEIFENFCIGK